METSRDTKSADSVPKTETMLVEPLPRGRHYDEIGKIICCGTITPQIRE